MDRCNSLLPGWQCHQAARKPARECQQIAQPEGHCLLWLPAQCAVLLNELKHVAGDVVRQLGRLMEHMHGDTCHQGGPWTCGHICYCMVVMKVCCTLNTCPFINLIMLTLGPERWQMLVLYNTWWTTPRAWGAT